MWRPSWSSTFCCFQDYCSLLCHPEIIKSDGMRRPSWSSYFIVFNTIKVSFAIQRQSSPMAYRDNHGHPFSLSSRLFQFSLPSRDKQVHWHAENINVFRFFSFSKTTRVFSQDFNVSLTLQDFKIFC